MEQIQHLTCTSVVEGEPFTNAFGTKLYKFFLTFSDGQEGQYWAKTQDATANFLKGPRWYRVELMSNKHGDVLKFSPASAKQIEIAKAQKPSPTPATKEQPPIHFPPSPAPVAHVLDDLIVATATEATVRLIAAGLVPLERMRPAMERIAQHMRDVVQR